MGLSVLMSVYQKENPEYFKQAMQSVLEQSRPSDEIILIQDGPVPEPLQEVIEYYEKTIEVLTVFRFEENVQLGRALAKGVELASQNLIARMDTDDIAVSNRFEIQYDYMMKHPEVAAIGGFMEEFCDDDSEYHKIKTMPEHMGEIRKYAKYRNPLNHMTVMFRKDEVQKVGNYQHCPFLEDYDLWCRMLANGAQFYNIQRVLVRARTDRNLYSRRGGNSYCRNYLQLRKRQRQMGLLNFGEYQLAKMVTIGMTLQPSTLRKLVYQKILRKQE